MTGKQRKEEQRIKAACMETHERELQSELCLPLFCYWSNLRSSTEKSDDSQLIIKSMRQVLCMHIAIGYDYNFHVYINIWFLT